MAIEGGRGGTTTEPRRLTDYGDGQQKYRRHNRYCTVIVVPRPRHLRRADVDHHHIFVSPRGLLCARVTADRPLRASHTHTNRFEVLA